MQLDPDIGLPLGPLFCIVPEGLDLASCQHLSPIWALPQELCCKGSTGEVVVPLMPPDHVQRTFSNDPCEENNAQLISLFLRRAQKYYQEFPRVIDNTPKTHMEMQMPQRFPILSGLRSRCPPPPVKGLPSQSTAVLGVCAETEVFFHFPWDGVSGFQSLLFKCVTLGNSGIRKIGGEDVPM